MAISRRQLLGGMLAAPVLAACRGTRDTIVRDERPHAPRPRAFVHILMRGGMDAVLSTNPKLQQEVDESVDVPYGPGDILEVNGHRFGPHLEGLASQLGAFAIINNVHVGTARHETGEPQFARLRMQSAGAPTASDVIGWYRQGPPLGAIAVSGRIVHTISPGMLDCSTRRLMSDNMTDLCDSLFAMPREQLERSAEALDVLVANAAGEPETQRHSRDVAAFMRKVAVTPPPHLEKWAEETDPKDRMFFGGPQVQYFQKDLQRVLWMLENELVSCITLAPREFEWDSHSNNVIWQSRMSLVYFPLIARFMQELQTRRNAHGTLASQTMLVMGSELGRHPRLNDHHGKDHFPETPMFVAGPNVRPGVYGESGRRMEGMPVSLATGRPDTRGTVPNLDDVGATVMRAFGIDPLAHGYTGRHLEFLVDA